jgi:hypothetical protein
MIAKIRFIIIIIILMPNIVGASENISENFVNKGLNEVNFHSGVDGFSIPSGLPEEIKQRIINRSLMGMTEEQKMQVLKRRVPVKPEILNQHMTNMSFFGISNVSMLGGMNESGIPNFIGQQISNQNLTGMPKELRKQYLNNRMQVQSANPGIMSSSITISGNVSLLWEKHTSNNYTYAYAVNDLDGDNKPDILVQSWSISGTTQTASLTVLRGYDGYQLWTKSVSGTSASIYGNVYGDLSGDGKPDFIVQSYSISGTTQTASLTALRGYDGYQLWTRSVSGDVGYTSLYASVDQDFTGDNLLDVIIEARTRTGTFETYSITGLRSYDGYQLWSKSVSGDVGYNNLYVSYQDLTGDNLPDVIIEAQSKSGTAYTASVTGFQGNNGAQLWSKSISGTSVGIYGYSAGDLSGDGKPDILIGMYLYNGGLPVTATTYALRGYDGYQLWSKSISGTSVSIDSFPAGDLSGDGISDVMIEMSVYNAGSTVTATAYALRGYDG